MVGAKCLDSYVANYVYIPSNVKYIGNQAFYCARLYLEFAQKPTSWASVITSDSNWNGVISLNCKKNDDYIYSIEADEVTIYQYIGTERILDVVSTIEGKPVTKIGYGFASIGGNDDENVLELLEGHELEPNYHSLLRTLMNPLDIIFLPEGIKEIGRWAFVSSNETVIIPNTVESIYESSLSSLDDDFGLKSFIFEGSDAPAVLNENDGTVNTSITKDTLLGTSASLRCTFGVERTRLYFDDLFCYQDDGYTYSILSYLGYKTENLLVPATYNGKNIATIARKAIATEEYLKSIVFSEGIQIIRPYGIYYPRANSIYIPGKPVLAIKSDAFSGLASYSLVLPHTFKTINGYAFSNNIAITGITIPASVERIMGGAFLRCSFRTPLA